MSKNIKNSPVRIAAIVTVFFPISHADVILSRWNKPRAGDPQWDWDPQGKTRIVKVCVIQHPQDQEDGKNDISRQVAEEQGFVLVDSIEEALTSGGKLDVDGVILIGEHGDYPLNEKGQKLYPRKELFDQITAVFEKVGKSVPVFNDKHLSWNPEWAVKMVETAHRLKFPLMAGSSIPHCQTEPSVEIREGEVLEEAVALYYGGEESYGVHSIEFLQSFIEKRRGGEPGVRQITAWRGEAMEAQLNENQRALITAALQASSSGAPEILNPWVFDDPKSFVLYRFEHFDGFVSWHLKADRWVKGWGIAIKVQGDPQIRAGEAVAGGAATHYAHFARLNGLIEKMFLTGVSPVPLERVLLATQMIAYAMEALQQEGKPLPVNLPVVSL